FVQHAASRLDSGALGLAGTALRCGGGLRRCGPAIKPSANLGLGPRAAIRAGQLADRKTAIANPVCQGGAVIDDAERLKIDISQAFFHYHSDSTEPESI